MPRIEYVPRSFSESSRQVIAQADAILCDYAQQGYTLTLRQLYYQFVARDLIANTHRSYKRLGSIVNDARLAGLLDWAHITDRTRAVEEPPHWDSPHSIVGSAAASFAMDKWRGQDFRPEVWIEKDALVGVIAPVCEQLDVPYLSCRGYVSQSECWKAGQRFAHWLSDQVEPVIIHLGDHDPSGIDMTRDIRERVSLFAGEPIRVERVALNRDQVDHYRPPPNPAKTTDSRCADYIEQHGHHSWELDALEPRVLGEVVETAVERFMSRPLWDRRQAEQEEHRRVLESAAERWDEVADMLEMEE